MSSNNIAISVKAVGKRFEIYENPSDRLKQFFLPKLQKLFRLSPKNYYKEFVALDNVSFDVDKGETFGILGRNGAGKSTLLQIISGTLMPTFGEVRIEGRVAALLELGSGFNPEFTGRENIFMNAAVLGLSTDQIEERYDEIVKFSEIADFIDQPVKTYSSGMLVRLAFSTAIHVDPDVLIVDEALAVGDFAFQHKCMLKIKQLKTQGVTLLLVSHDVGAVSANCNRAMLLKKGVMQSIGDAHEICNRYLEKDINTDISVIETVDPAPNHTNALDLNHLSLIEPTYRWGCHGVEILKWGLMNASGKVSNSFKFGEKIKLSILIKANKSVPSCFPGFVFMDRNGYHLTGITNRTCGKEIQALNKNDTLLLEFEITLYYRADNYSVLINIAYDEFGSNFYDLCENVGNFTVLDDDLYRPPWGYGRTYLPTQLEIINLGQAH